MNYSKSYDISYSEVYKYNSYVVPQGVGEQRTESGVYIQMYTRVVVVLVLGMGGLERRSFSS